MALLHAFPPEVIDLVVSNLSAVEICRLTATGNRNLASKVFHAQRLHLSLSWPSSSWIPWPSHFIRKFTNLQSLDWSSGYNRSCCPTLDLDYLPSSLESLSIIAEDVLVRFLHRKYNLDTMFPNLRRLKLIGAQPNIDNLKLLPPNLTEFVLGGHEALVGGIDIFGDLPRSLLTLKLDIRIEDDQEVGNDLPPNLTKLHVSRLRTSCDWFTKLPSSVTDLSISTKAQIWCAFLPSGLLKLKLHFPSVLLGSDLPNLPKGLLHLHTSFDGGVTDQIMGALPPNLTYFRSWGTISREGLLRAPKSITKLMVDVISDSADILADFNPDARVVSLTLSSNDPNQNGILNPFPLPLRLSQLSLSCISDDICLMLPPTIVFLSAMAGQITAKGAAKFPTLSQLISLRTLTSIISDEVMPFLSNVKDIIVIGDAQQSIKECLLSFNFISLLLPPYATDPALVGSQPPTHQLSSREVVGLGNKHEASIPRLEALTLLFESAEQASFFLVENALVSLSQFLGLKRLTINAAPTAPLPATSTWFRHFPPQLELLNVALLDSFPDTSTLDSLPKGLTDLELQVISHQQACPWADSDLAHLPPLLQSFNINGALVNLSQNMEKFAPRFLTRFANYGRPFDLFEGPVTKAADDSRAHL